jgi:hypothetical protein
VKVTQTLSGLRTPPCTDAPSSRTTTGPWTAPRWLLGAGDGSFAGPIKYAGGSPVAVGDFNDDGRLDLVAGTGGSVSMLLGAGDGTFAVQTSYTVGSDPYSLAVGDFNGDGMLDLATANQGSNDVSVLLGAGNGSFAAQSTYAAGVQPHSVAVGGAMAGAGAVGGATGAGLNGGSVGDIAVAALWGAAGGVLGGLASSYAQDGLLYMLEGTGIDLASALHVAAALGMSSSGAATGFAIEGVHDLFDVNYQANYARAAGLGAVSGLGSYLGAEVSGNIRSPGEAYGTAEDALRAAQWQNQAIANQQQVLAEYGSVVYEWGGDYYHTGSIRSGSYDNIEPMDVVADEDTWIPPGSTNEAFSHAHPPPLPGHEAPPEYKYVLSTGDVSRAEANYEFYMRGEESGFRMMGASNPDGSMEYWCPGRGRSPSRGSAVFRRTSRWLCDCYGRSCCLDSRASSRNAVLCRLPPHPSNGP